jgi:hypothetical protein
MADHADHIHIGWRPLPGAAHQPGSAASGRGQTPDAEAALSPKQWLRLIDRLGKIANPKVDPDLPDVAGPRRLRANG